MWCNFEHDFFMIFMDFGGHLGTQDVPKIEEKRGEFSLKSAALWGERWQIETKTKWRENSIILDTHFILDLFSRRNRLANFAVTLDLSLAEGDWVAGGHKLRYKSCSSSLC